MPIADCGNNTVDNCPHEERRAQEPWRFEHKVRLDVMLSFISLLLAGIGYIVYHAKWETHVDDVMQSLSESDKRLEKSTSVDKDVLNKRLDRIEDKLDAALDRRRAK